MPVISSRRSSNSASGSLYRTTTGTGGSSASATSNNSSSSSSTFSKPSSYYSFLSSYSPSSYTPNTSAYRSSYTPSTYLSGGSSTLGTYRSTSSQFESSLNDRYGLNKKPPSGDTLRRGDLHTTTTNATTANNTSGSSYESDRLTKKPPSGESTRDINNQSSNRLSASLSSSSLARYVATSALDIYEKYSPAHYKPNTDLTRSSSRSSLADANETTNNSSTTNYDNNNDITTHVTLERPRSRYSRLYSNESPLIKTTSTNDTDTTDCSTTTTTATNRRRGTERLYSSSSANALNLSQSNSSSDVPTATFTLRNRALSSGRSVAKTTLDGGDNGSEVILKNGIVNGLDKELKELKLKHDTTTTATATITTNNNDINNYNNNNATNSNDVEVSVTLKLLDENKQNDKVRSSSMTIPGATLTPTSSRYYERSSSSNRNSTHTPSSYITNGEGENGGNNSLGTENREGLVGLRNIGNTCFMNSIIQCLSHTSELTNFLRQHEQTTNSRAPAKDQQILNEFARLIKDMWSGMHSSATPMELKRAFSSKHRMYSDYNQQDAQEFLRFFLDSLHCALSTGVKGEPLKIDDNLSDNKKADLTWEWYARHENSLIRDLFVGQLKSTLRCTVCGNTSVTFDPFWDLSVSLPSSTRCKLEQCLDMFIREEVLDGDEMPTCAKCKTRRKCTKSFSIQRFPKYLVIHLKRFSETRWSKLSNMVEFPTDERELNMGPYGSNANSNVYYSLYGISNHMGSTAGGHYVAVCKHPQTRRWHEFNDNIVSSADKTLLVSSSAYILFYERA